MKICKYKIPHQTGRVDITMLLNASILHFGDDPFGETEPIALHLFG